MDYPGTTRLLTETIAGLASVYRPTDQSVLPDAGTAKACRGNIVEYLTPKGIGTENVIRHLLNDLAPGFNRSSLSPNYYGFVTGGITPAARVGDTLTSFYDQNTQVHLPDETISTDIEARALQLLLDLFEFDRSEWTGIFTTGATSSNVLGLLLAREWTVNKSLETISGLSDQDRTVGSCGLIRACHLAQIEDIVIFTTRPHSSLLKAASVAGIGRNNVVDVGGSNENMGFDLTKLETVMAEHHKRGAIIVVVSCGEVNSGFFATNNLQDMQDLRSICTKYGAWLHVDAGMPQLSASYCHPLTSLKAFGLFARLLSHRPDFYDIAQGAAGLELADSIAGDAHKLLNVPYDCGFFYYRENSGLAKQVFQNPNAAYLTALGSSNASIESSLNVGIENSRRFRGLAVYATLVAYGKMGYEDMLIRQISLAQAVASFISSHPLFDLLPSNLGNDEAIIKRKIFIIVLFKAKDDAFNSELVKRINRLGAVYVSGTSWNGYPAARFAIANWQVDVARDLQIIQNVINRVGEEWQWDSRQS